MILITRGDERAPYTFIIDPLVRETLGQFGSVKSMTLADTVNYLLTLLRLVDQFKFTEEHFEILSKRKPKPRKTTIFLTLENYHYLIRLTDDSFYKPIHVFNIVIGEALELAKTHSLDYVIKKDEMLSSTH